MATSNISPNHDLIQQLPAELQNEITGLIGYGGALMLYQTNSFYHEHLKPDNIKLEAKIDFLKVAQLFQKHNVCYVIPAPQHMRTATWKINNYACYTCFRVRPYHAFPTRHIRDLHDKAHALEGAIGYKRRCIDCAIEEKLYRTRTRISVPQTLWAFVTPIMQPIVINIPKFFCGTCQTLKDLTDDNPSAVCGDCGAISKKDVRMSLTHDENGTYHTCKQCEKTTTFVQGAGCWFCGGPVCGWCGYDVPGSGWWCGRACSPGGLACCDEAAAGGAGAFRPKLAEIMVEKRVERVQKMQQDGFWEWEDEPFCLRLLE